MLHVDIPSRSDIEQLIKVRAPACLSLYLRTTPVTQDAQADRIALKNLARTGLDRLRAQDAEKRGIAAIEEEIDDLVDDDNFWAFQAHSLAVFATPETTLTFRLPNALEPIVEAGDRFYIKPLLRAARAAVGVRPGAGPGLRAPHRGFRRHAGLRANSCGHAQGRRERRGKASILDRSPSGRLQGSEGQKVRLRQYARQVDQALRELLAGRETPLILATAPPIDSIYRLVNTYPHLVEGVIPGSPERVSAADLTQASRGVLDRLHAPTSRSSNDSSRPARPRGAPRRHRSRRTRRDLRPRGCPARRYRRVVPGVVSGEDGSVVFSDSVSTANHGVVDQIAGRALLSGARVLGVRRGDIPGDGSLAAILRYPF